MVNQELTTKEIVEKDFDTKLRGYDPDEVDAFLDAIIRDYDAFLTEINHLREENTMLEDKLQRAEKEQNSYTHPVNESAEMAMEQNEQVAQNTSNYDILKRLSNLEREVFGEKLNKGDE